MLIDVRGEKWKEEEEEKKNKGKSCCYAGWCVGKRVAGEMWRRMLLLCGVHGLLLLCGSMYEGRPDSTTDQHTTF